MTKLDTFISIFANFLALFLVISRKKSSVLCLGPGMSKRTLYGKIYHPDVCFIWTSADVNYPADAFLPADTFLLFAPTIKKCIRADRLMRPHGRALVSSRTQVRPRGRD
jgi:hypothetical protein